MLIKGNTYPPPQPITDLHLSGLYATMRAMRGKKWQLYVMIWMVETALMLVIFSCSRAMAEQGQGLMILGLQGGLLAFASSMTSIRSGRLSDRIGRQWVVAGGLLMILLGAGLCLLLFPDRATIFWGYLLIGIGSGAFYPAISAWLTQGKGTAAATRQATRTLIRFCLAWNLGIVSGQTAGGWLFAWRGGTWPLYVAIILLLVNLIWIFLLPKNVSAAPGQVAKIDVALAERTARSAAFARICWIANLGGAFSMSMIFFLLPDLVMHLNISADKHGMVVAASRVIVLSTYMLMYYSHFWHYRFSTALCSQGLGIVGLIMVVLASNVWMLMLGLVGLAIMMGYCYFSSIFYSTTGSCDQTRGAALGMHEATIAAGFAAGPTCGGLLGGVAGPRSPYILAACVVGVTSLVQIVLYRRRIGKRS